MDRSPLFIPLAETRHVTCRCGAAAEQRCPQARLARAPTVARPCGLTSTSSHPQLAAQWDNPGKPYQ